MRILLKFVCLGLVGMKRHLDKGRSYKIKDIVRGLITDPKGNSMIIKASNMLEGRHAGSQGSELPTQAEAGRQSKRQTGPCNSLLKP